jgi:hypothetical protein
MALISNDLGGPDNLTQAELAVVRRSCVLIIALEKMETEFAQTPMPSADDLDLYQRLGNSMRRMLREVGLKRRPKDVTAPTDLQAYLRSKRGNRSTTTINGTASRIHAADNDDD